MIATSSAAALKVLAAACTMAACRGDSPAEAPKPSELHIALAGNAADNREPPTRIAQKYRVMGARDSRLGSPTSHELPLPSGGRVSYFDGGPCNARDRGPHDSASAIYAGERGVFAVEGCIYLKYVRDHGGTDGPLGYPVADEQAIAGGKVSYFQGGACGTTEGPHGARSGIYAHAATGVRTVLGCVFAAYQRYGGPAGPLGFPTSDELALADGSVTYFVGSACGTWRGPHSSAGAIYASAAGAFIVKGCIYKKYIELGGPLSSRLGFPTTPEIAVTGGWISYFQHGYIFADGTSVRAVHV